jgi:LysR family transcriptional regulator (chromosome initiation inhibitor)
MPYNAAGVEALVAIADHGTFEAAARALHVSPSAVSQRIRALEREVGRVVVRRGTPCQPTEAGTALVRLGLQSRLLDDEARAALQAETGRVEVTAAVNADSLATWFRDVLAEVGGRDDLTLRLVVEDQAYSAALLRSGEALAAVTSDPQAVQGCRSEHLGFLRYRPAATPGLAERWRKGNGHDWQRLPVVVFNAKDDLQHDFLRDRGVPDPDVVHLVPTSADFHEAVRLGLGWGMLPEPQLRPDLDAGRLVTLGGRVRHDVHLHWQRWRIDSAALETLTEAVRRAARSHLRR